MSHHTQNASMFAMNPTQVDNKSKQYVQNNIDSGLYAKKVEETVQYLLYCCLAEKRVLFKRADINKHILKEHSRAFLAVINDVKHQMNSIFGFDIVELDEKQEKYGIKNKFEFDINIHNRAIQTTNDALNEINKCEDFDLTVKYTLLMIALALIFMNDNELDASQLWESLKRIDINKNEKRHTFIGDVEKYFTSELVKDGYLEYEQIPNTDPPAFKFKWGYRAKLEISKMDVLNFVCEMFGGTDVVKPEEWMAQYNDATKEEQT